MLLQKKPRTRSRHLKRAALTSPRCRTFPQTKLGWTLTGFLATAILGFWWLPCITHGTEVWVSACGTWAFLLTCVPARCAQYLRQNWVVSGSFACYLCNFSELSFTSFSKFFLLTFLYISEGHGSEPSDCTLIFIPIFSCVSLPSKRCISKW